MLNYLDWELSPEQQMIQGVVREFVEREALPLIPDAFEKGEFPRALIPRLGELGLLGPTIPRYGSGLDYTSYGLICQELERGDSGLRSFVSVQGSLVMFPISAYGSEEQKQRYLPRMHAACVLPGVRGLRGPLSALNEARFGIIFGVVGAAMACYEAALEYAGLRSQFGRPIAGFQLTQNKLVDALQAITSGQLMAYQLGRLKDAGKLRPAQVSLGKRANVTMALEVARCMRSVLGANGISLEHPIFRHMENLESVYTYEGTHEIHTLVVGADITGLPAYA